MANAIGMLVACGRHQGVGRELLVGEAVSAEPTPGPTEYVPEGAMGDPAAVPLPTCGDCEWNPGLCAVHDRGGGEA